MSFVPLARRAPVRPRSASGHRRAHLYRRLSLWVLQTWLALFYIAAGYAKLTQPQDTLALLMVWPGRVDLAWVQVVGWAETTLALALLAPLISWPRLRFVLLLAAPALMVEATVMAVFHAFEGSPGLAGVNALLIAMSLAVVVGRWRYPSDATR